MATLILILIAVAAAAALYLWLVGWQGSVTGSISKPGVNQGSFTLGGSTSVYPFSSLAVTQYEQNNTGVTITNTQGGTGAGLLALCAGQLDVASASSLQTPATLIANDNCPSTDASTITVQVVAYDAVDLITEAANPHGLYSISADTLYGIYYAQSTSAPTTAAPTTFNGVAIAGEAAVSIAAPVFATSGNLGLAWDEIPACVTGTTAANCGGSSATQAADTAATNSEAVCGTALNEICFTAGGGALTSSCGFIVCAGGTGGAYASPGGPVKGTGGAPGDPIVTVQRSDTSGTTQAFTARMLGIKGTTLETSLATQAADYTGCGTDGQLGSCNIAATVGESGNPAVISYVSTSKDALGYASDGLTRVAGSGVNCQGVATAACGIGFEAYGQANAVQPSLTSTGTIAASISDPTASGSAATTGEYIPWRPFSFITLAPPTGVVLSFESFVLQPGVNTALATESDEISIYSI